MGTPEKQAVLINQTGWKTQAILKLFEFKLDFHIKQMFHIAQTQNQ